VRQPIELKVHALGSPDLKSVPFGAELSSGTLQEADVWVEWLESGWTEGLG
jgi:hypothetical protein